MKRSYAMTALPEPAVLIRRKTLSAGSLSLCFILLALTANPAFAEIRRIFDNTNPTPVCLPGPGCSATTLLPVMRGVANEFTLEGPWVDWARISIVTVDGSGSVSSVILEQNSPRLGEGRMRIRLSPIATATGVRRIRLLRRTNELNPMVPNVIGEFRVQIVRNGRVTGMTNPRVTAGQTVIHTFSGTDIGNATLVPQSPASITRVRQRAGDADTTFVIRAAYPGGRTHSTTATYRLRENVGPFNGGWYNWYYPTQSAAQNVSVLADQTASPPPPAPVQPQPAPAQPHPNPAPPDPLVAVEPTNRGTCVGRFAGSATIVDLSWRATNTLAHQALVEPFQLVVEHPTAPNCSNAPGLQLNQANAAFGYTPQSGCYVVPTNSNVTAAPLAPNTQYQWRVRRILPNGQFDAFTPTATFSTAGPPTGPITFIRPTASQTIRLSDPQVGTNFNAEWSISGCPPTTFSYRLIRDNRVTTTGSGVCPAGGDPNRCRVPIGVTPGSYRLEVTQNTQWGSVSGVVNFNVTNH